MYLKSFRYMSFFSCGRGKYLDKKVRSSENAAVLEFVSVADDQDILVSGRGSRQDLPILFDIANQPNYT